MRCKRFKSIIANGYSSYFIYIRHVQRAVPTFLKALLKEKVEKKQINFFLIKVTGSKGKDLGRVNFDYELLDTDCTKLLSGPVRMDVTEYMIITANNYILGFWHIKLCHKDFILKNY